ncbi:MAG: DUF4856 domain-containing protein [Bacteroidota bacterium]
MSLKNSVLCTILGLALISSCKKEDDKTETPTPTYTVPTTYKGFTNVDYTEATVVLGMTSAVSTEIAKGTGTAPATVPVPLNASTLKNMLTNSGNPFGNTIYDASGFQIQANSIAIAHTQTESYIDSLVMVSNTNAVAANGVAGLGITQNARRLLLTKNGINYAQILNKTLMGDLIYYQIAKRVLDNSLDNTTPVTGKNYTAMEHNWDLAFGYWSVPDSFPTVLTPVKFWGSYSNQVNGGLGCNAIVMNAFLKGRAAISNKDLTTKNEQAAIIVAMFDKMTAAAIIRELKECDVDIAANDMVQLVNHLSEAKAFAMSMKNNKNSGRVITDTQIETLLGFIPQNLWNTSLTDLTNIKTFIANVYGFTPTQMANM